MEKKFRAWDKKNKCWYKTELEFYGFHIFGECILICPPRASDLINLEVTQYTGLKDKNSKEIYEGDIMKYIKGGSFNRIVIWDDISAAFKVGRCDMFTAGAMEVIGNIYENPELLEAQDD